MATHIIDSLETSGHTSHHRRRHRLRRRRSWLGKQKQYRRP